jgi:hypothetical protein
VKPHRERIAAELARDWPEGVCHYCTISDDQVDGDRVRWLGRRRKVCNRSICVKRFNVDIDRAEMEDRQVTRKRTPADIHLLKMQEKRERRAASRARSRKRKAAA